VREVTRNSLTPEDGRGIAEEQRSKPFDVVLMQELQQRFYPLQQSCEEGSMVTATLRQFTLALGPPAHRSAYYTLYCTGRAEPAHLYVHVRHTLRVGKRDPRLPRWRCWQRAHVPGHGALTLTKPVRSITTVILAPGFWSSGACAMQASSA